MYPEITEFELQPNSVNFCACVILCFSVLGGGVVFVCGFWLVIFFFIPLYIFSRGHLGFIFLVALGSG